MTSLIRLRMAGIDSAVMSFNVKKFLELFSSRLLGSGSGPASSNVNVDRQLIWSKS